MRAVLLFLLPLLVDAILFLFDHRKYNFLFSFEFLELLLDILLNVFECFVLLFLFAEASLLSRNPLHQLFDY